MRKILHKNIHTKITFLQKSHCRKRSMRYSNDIQLLSPRTNYGKKNILYEGAQLYNKLPKEIKNTKTFLSFKNKLKRHILSDFSQFYFL